MEVPRKTRRQVKRARVSELLDTLIFIAASYFIIVGVLTLVFNTSSYWMGVVSGSMSHQGDPKWRLYFEDRTIRELLLTSEGLQHIIPEDHIYDTADFPIQDGFDRGDLIVVRGVNSVSEISVGDVIIIQRENNIPLTHRVLAAWEENGKIRFTTKGDHNPYLVGDDLVVRPEQIVGKVIYVIPNLGSFFLWFQGG